MFTRGILLLELVIFACEFGSRADTTDDKCDPVQAEDFAQSARYTNQSCLFEVWGVRKKVNVKQKGSDDFVLDADLALAICQYHNATLPVIDSEDKENFLLSLLEEGHAFLLGLKLIDGKSVWNSGQELTYSNEDWRHVEDPCYYTLLVQHASGPLWEDVPCEISRPDHVLTFCEESYTYKATPVDPVKPPWDMNDKCDPMNEHKFRRVKKFEDGSCYFEVDGADEEANRPTNVKKNGISHFTFDVELARQICNDYDATLPVLRSLDEEKWLLEFNDQNFNYIALGLQETSEGHRWDDGSPLTYSNEDWRQESENGTSYTLLVSSLAADEPYWMDAPADELIPNGVAILCKDDYNHVPVTHIKTVQGEFRRGEMANKTTPGHGPASMTAVHAMTGRMRGGSSSGSIKHRVMIGTKLLVFGLTTLLCFCQ